MLASVIIRTYNEEKHLPELLDAVQNQVAPSIEIEVVIVDSGSTDQTLAIAERYNCKIEHIKKEDFTFGRSLNVGCEYANGDFLVFVSGHCIPASINWLEKLVAPLVNGRADYSYGRQIGRDATKFSERCLFDKYFPDYSKVPQDGFYCNNANAALCKDVWKRIKFDENLTGLEDMYLAKVIFLEHGNIAYIADAPVYHIHDEDWRQVRLRYEREAYALQQIMPEVHLSIIDVVGYYFAGVYGDIRLALKKGIFAKEFANIALFRLMQYLGGYRGNHEHRKLSRSVKYSYFYPKDIEKHLYENRENRSLVADEGK